MRCVVVEDHGMFLQLLVAMLRAQEGLEVVGTALSVQEAIGVCLQMKPDLLILDLALPDGRGLEVAEALRPLRPQARVIVLSGEASSFVCPADLREMVHAVVDKTRAYGALTGAIEPLLRDSSGDAAAGGTELPTADHRPLTRREEEVLALIGRGHSSKEIAALLQLSLRTVETHRKNIVAKVGVSGPELVRMAALRLPFSGLPPPADPGPSA